MSSIKYGLKRLRRLAALTARRGTGGRSLRLRDDLVIRFAEYSASRGKLPRVAARLSRGLERSRRPVPPQAYIRLARIQQESGYHSTADAMLDRGRQQHPDDRALAIEHARLAMAQSAWNEAAARWEQVLGAHPETSGASSYRLLAIAHREAGRTGVAAAVVEHARARFPCDVSLAIEWAQLSMVARRWEQAEERWRAVIDAFPDEVPAKVFRWLAISLREQGDTDEAAVIIADARGRFPDDVRLAVEWAQLAVVYQDWEEAAFRLQTVLREFESTAPAKVFKRLATEYRLHGERAEAMAVLEAGLRRHPDDLQLHVELAHLAMVAEDWNRALALWARVIELRREGEEGVPPTFRLPPRHPAHDWHDVAWVSVADALCTPGRDGLDADVHRLVGTALEETDQAEWAGKVYAAGLQQHADDVGLLFARARNRVLRGASADTALRQLFERAPRPREDGWGNGSDPGGAVEQRPADVYQALDEFRPPADRGDGLGPLVVMDVPAGTSTELLIRGSQWFDRDRARRRVRELSERDQWPEIQDVENPILHRARAVADQIGRAFAQSPYLPAEALGDALFFLVYSELIVYEPMRRLAQEIAETNGGEPVFVHLPNTKLTYLNGYVENNFGQIYLYVELRRRGVNAVLVRIEDEATQEDLTNRRFVVAPARSLMQAARPSDEDAPAAAHQAVVPAGVRGVRTVLAGLSSPILYASGFLTQEFAYDRSLRDRKPLEPDASVHPPRSLLPTFHFPLWTATRLPAVDFMDPDGPRSIEVPVRTSPSLEGDWDDWIMHALGPYLDDLARRCFAEVSARGVEEAHVSDHLFAEPVLYAAAVQRQGGRVVLWPHSANPAHVEVRRPDSFDVVHAVTRTGCEQWQQRFPDAKVLHAPNVMLDRPRSDVQLDATRPLSVIVLGGKTVLGSMPFVDQSEHEAAYQRFFAGLERLQQDENLRVFYKGKGLGGENEPWLHRLVGRTANWERALEHPLRISLPNPLFVSVSVGTSGLLEGISRGIPCLIVRDFPARDYTTLADGEVPIGPTDDMLKVIAECARPGGLQTLIDRQTAYYLDETGYTADAG